MNKWEKLFWEGKQYLIVPNPSNDPSKSSCRRCAFAGNADLCPRYAGMTLYCIVYEKRRGKEACIIHDTPESVANYIADTISS